MNVRPADIPDVLILEPARLSDPRGFFSEVFKASVLSAHGIDLSFVQDNHSYSARRGTVRGLHFQRAPQAQAKIVRVVRGAVLDVAIDIRPDSPTFGRHIAIELSAENWRQVFIPEGFAHGFCTLTDHAEILYKVSAPYAPGLEAGVCWSDPELGIPWPVDPAMAMVSERDAALPFFRDVRLP